MLSLSEEREQFQKLAREFAEGEIAKISESFDRSGEFPQELIQKAWEIGLVNFQIPETLDGMGLKVLDSAIILEELAKGCSGISASIEASAIAITPLLHYGSEEQQKEFLTPLTSECMLAGYASQDATADSVEVKVEGESFILSGRHDAVINAGHASWYFVVANHQDANLGATAFVVPADAKGIEIQGRLNSLGRRARVVQTVEFKEVELSSANVIGEVGKAACVIESILPAMYCFLAAGATGVAACALTHAIEYSKQRHTFGRPISQHQGVAFMLAEMAREIEAARYMTWQASYLLDEEKPAFHEALKAKAYATDACMKVTVDAVQVFGGYGFSREYPVEKLMRDSKVYQLSEQSPHELKSILARDLVGCS